MKLSLILMLAAVFNTTASVYSQSVRVDLELKNATLENVFQSIQEQTEFDFFYKNEHLPKDKLISRTFTNARVDRVLDDVLEGTGLMYRVLNKDIVVTRGKSSDTGREELFTQQETKIVTGKVTDAKGQPLPGVTVVVKATTQGTVTNTDGEYSLANIPEDATLVFSFVGMKSQEVTVGNQTNINVTLEQDMIGIEEVVAIGYGTMKKRDLTGSIVSADIESFRESPNISIVQSLQGTVPGLNIGQVTSAGQDPSILIRGINTFDSDNTAPLIVLDGVIFSGDLVDLNPRDIESVEILKDASSTAIYGSRAANGVIIITTKKGKDYGKPVFSYSGSYSFQEPANYMKLLDREGYIEKSRDALWEEGYLAPDYTEPNPDFDPTTGWTQLEIKRGYENGTDFDWWDAATQMGHIQEHNLSMRGRNDRTSYYVSTGFTDQLGYIMNDKFKRWTVRINLENKILDWLSVGMQSFASSGDYSGASPALRYIIWMSPLTTPYDENGELALNPSGGAAVNPFFSSEVDDLEKQLDLFTNFYADVNIPFIKGLSYRFNYSHNYRTNRHFYASEYENNLTGEAYKSNSTSYDWTFDNILTYKNNFDDHDLNITLVSGREEREYEYTKADGQIFSNLDLGYNNLEVAENQYIFSRAWDESSLYYMGRLHYGFRKKYLATFTVRRDGFSGFSEKNKFGVFPSGALAWVPSEETFIKENLNWLEFLKIRASYGTSGNRTLGRYGTLAKVEAGQNYVFGDITTPSVGQRITTMANPDLTWETTTGINLGLDFSVLDNRLRGNIEYYDTNTKDILYDITIPSITGYVTITSNLGKVHNNGIEFSLSGTPIKKQNFNWDITFNFSRNRNRIESILGMDNDGDGKEDDIIADALFIGKSLGAIYDYQIEGIYQLDDDIPDGYQPGQYIVKNLDDQDGITPENDRTILGYKLPSYRFSVNNAFHYRNWSLRVFINSVQGGKDWYYAANEAASSWGESNNITNGSTPKWDWWTPNNPDAEYAQLFNRTPLAPRSYRQRSFVRLQDVSLSYTLGKSIVEKVGIQGLKIYISGKNLYTWTDWQGWDPETGQGITRDGRPVLRSYSLGVDLSF